VDNAEAPEVANGVADANNESTDARCVLDPLSSKYNKDLL
jgi:hypothetical protein